MLLRRAGKAVAGTSLRCSGRVRPGFTLIELLLVIAVGGIVMSFAAARVDTVSMQVTSTARQVGMTLLAAQRLAVLRQHGIVVAFDVAGNQLRIHEDRNNNGAIDGGEKLTYMELERSAMFGRGEAPAMHFGHKDISLAKKQNGMPAITFHRSGSASEMGGLYITSRRAVGSSQHATDARALVITRATGRASYFTYDGSAWKRGF